MSVSSLSWGPIVLLVLSLSLFLSLLFSYGGFKNWAN